MLRSTRRQFVAQTASLPALIAAQAPNRAPIMSAGYSPEKLAGILLPRDRWKPFATASDRGPWEQLSADARRAAG